MCEPVIRQKAHALAVEFVGTSRRDVTYEEAIDMLLAMTEFCTKRQTDKSIKVYPDSVTYTRKIGSVTFETEFDFSPLPTPKQTKEEPKAEKKESKKEPPKGIMLNSTIGDCGWAMQMGFCGLDCPVFMDCGCPIEDEIEAQADETEI